MSHRALLLASLILLTGCGGAASMDAAPNDARKSGGPGGTGDRTRSLQMDDQVTGEGKQKPPGDVLAEAQGVGSAAPDSGPMLTGQGAPGDKGGKNDPEKPGTPPTGLRAAVVDSSTPLGNGRLTPAQITKILEKGGDVFGECYTLGAGGANKDFRATVAVKATIGPAGNVNAVEVTRSTANNPKVDACVAQAFKKVKFPAPADGATSVITFPITFNGIEAVK